MLHRIDRKKDRDDFDGTNDAAISTASQADATFEDAGTEPGGGILQGNLAGTNRL